MQRNTALGILAHVDAGKTTLTESILLTAGAIRRAGRVDHRDTFLDTDVQERERGITIYAKNAMFTYNDRPFTILDTPGHSDFAGETERAIGVTDLCVLVISAPDGIQGHTLTLWKLLETYEKPVIIFINKMDMPGCDKARLMAELKKGLSSKCASVGSEDFCETAVTNDDAALETYLETGTVDPETVTDAVLARQLFPCVFGSALKHEGTGELLDAVSKYSRPCPDNGVFSAKVYKIARDSKGERMAMIKVTGGMLKVRQLIAPRRSEEEAAEEKVNAIRFYSGEKFTVSDTAPAGSVCAVTGLKNALAGDVLGQCERSVPPVMEPVFTYRVILPEDTDPHTALGMFKTIEEEDPLLRVKWNAALQEISVSVMGDVEVEILTRVIRDRFKLNVSFGSGSIVYKETIAAPADGCGHYEPIRHYAEVHLRLEPGAPGSGIKIRSEVSTDELALSWQRLIFTHLIEKTHVGVLTGSPLTDVSFTLTAGRAHLKHTEGGDFRQATYRAVRQALMGAENVLLEPWYEMELTLPDECAGRAMTDITRMGGEFEPAVSENGQTRLTARAPVSKAAGYQREIQIYTRGRGRSVQRVCGYRRCPEQDKIISAIGYDPERDTENSPDSVFCSHGAGTLVKWSEAPAHMHIQPGGEREGEPESDKPVRRSGYFDTDKELMAIFERTYGKTAPRLFDQRPRPAPAEPVARVIDIPARPEYLLVDGYNIIFAWKELASAPIDIARKQLADILDNYAGVTGHNVILVYDAYKVSPNAGRTEKYGKIEIVYTREAQTADSYIEKTAHELSRYNRVRVATGDGLEQLIILGSGALRMSAKELRSEIGTVNAEIDRILDGLSLRKAGVSVQKALADAIKEKIQGK